MIEIAKNLFIGTQYEAEKLSIFEYRFLNLTSTYHYKLHGWQRGTNYQENKCYVVHEGLGVLSINWFDGDAKYYDWQGKGVEVFKKILTYIHSNLQEGRKVLVFCNKAESRSPTVALMYMIKYLKLFPGDFDIAREKFKEMYPQYAPKGIVDFVSQHWAEI